MNKKLGKNFGQPFSNQGKEGGRENNKQLQSFSCYMQRQ